MNNEIRQILEDVQKGNLSVDDALLKIKVKPFEDIGYAKVDLHRKVRKGAAEVIYGEGKTAEQIIGILEVMQKNSQGTILITRLAPEVSDAIGEKSHYLSSGGKNRYRGRASQSRLPRQCHRSHRRHQRYPGRGGGCAHG